MTCFVVYVDGSFNLKTNVYGGGYLILAYDLDVLNVHKSRIGYFNGNHEVVRTQRHIAGECGATLIALEALQPIFKPQSDTLEIRYDYMGIEQWALGLWKAKKPTSIGYITALKPYQHWLNEQTFTHINGHTGELGNEYVDKVARFAVGVNIGLPPKPEFAKNQI